MLRIGGTTLLVALWSTAFAVGDARAQVAECHRLTASSLETPLPAGIAALATRQIDHAAAVPACRRAVEEAPTDPRSKFGLARALAAAKGEAGEIARLVREAAEAGFPPAMMTLSQLHTAGLGVSTDLERSAAWMRRAAATGHPQAKRLYGRMLDTAQGVPRDQAEANRWYREAADAGDVPAMVFLAGNLESGTGIRKDPAEALILWRRAAEAGNAEAMRRLAIRFDNGDGVAADPEAAVRWYRSAAEKADLTAMYYLADNLSRGRGVARDEGQAAVWMKKAAEGGAIEAMRRWATMLELGTGVAKNSAEAVVWYRKAADAGNVSAMYLLALTLQAGVGTAKDPSEAAKWLRSAADRGHAVAMRHLGIAHDEGDGVAKDRTAALDWYRKAAAAGDRPAKRYAAAAALFGLGREQSWVDAERALRELVAEGDRDSHGLLAQLLYVKAVSAERAADKTTIGADAHRIATAGIAAKDRASLYVMFNLHRLGIGTRVDAAQAAAFKARFLSAGADDGDLRTMRMFWSEIAEDTELDKSKSTCMNSKSPSESIFACEDYLGGMAKRDFHPLIELRNRAAAHMVLSGALNKLGAFARSCTAAKRSEMLFAALENTPDTTASVRRLIDKYCR